MGVRADRKLFNALKPWLARKRCRTCDCTQAALAQLELDGSQTVGRLAARYRLPASKVHPCLGCEPCPPAEAWAAFIQSLSRREQEGKRRGLVPRTAAMTRRKL